MSFALIGGSFLKLRPAGLNESIFRRMKKLPTGQSTIIIGVVLIAGYVGYTEVLLNKGEETTSIEQAILLLWHTLIFCSLAFGFWQMSFRAYASRMKQIILEETRGRNT